jgi:3-oxosteroid 1-dehydrogenase
MRQRYQHHPVDAGWTVGHVGNTGDGLTLAEQAGACLDTDMMHNCWWSPAVMPPGEPTAWVLVIEKSLPMTFAFLAVEAMSTDVGTTRSHSH